MIPKIPYRSQAPSFLRSIFCPQEQEKPEHKETLLAVKDRITGDVVFRGRFLSFMRYVQGAYSIANREKLLGYAQNILQLKETDFKNLESFAQHRNKLHWFYTTSVSDFLSDAGYGFFAKYRCFTAAERKIFEKTAKFEAPPLIPLIVVRPTWLPRLSTDLTTHISSFLGPADRARLAQTCSSLHYDLLRNSEITLRGDIAGVLKSHLGRGRASNPAIKSLRIFQGDEDITFSELQSCVRAFPNLKQLKLKSDLYRPSDFDLFRALEPISNHLKRFEYGSVGYHLKGSLPSLPQLEAWITPQIQVQGNILQQLTLTCPKLTEMQLGEYSGDKSILVNFITAHASQLKSFKIWTMQATPVILEALGLCTQLKEIQLSRYDGPESVLVEFIKTHFGQLQVFDMPGVDVTEGILGALLSCTQLAEVRLNLGDNKKATMDLLTQLPSLRALRNSDSNPQVLKLDAQDDLIALAKSPVETLPTLLSFAETCLKEDIVCYIKNNQLKNLQFIWGGRLVTYRKGDLHFSVMVLPPKLRDKNQKTQHWQDTVDILDSLLQRYSGYFQNLSVDFGDWYPFCISREQRRAFSHWLLETVTKKKQLVELLLPPLDADQEILKSSLGKLTNLRVLRPACVLSVDTIRSFHKLTKLQRLDGVGVSDPDVFQAIKDLQKAIPMLWLN